MTESYEMHDRPATDEVAPEIDRSKRWTQPLGSFEGGELELPNGIYYGDTLYRKLLIREIMGDEDDMLLNRDFNKRGVAVLKVLQACTVAIEGETDRKLINGLIAKLPGPDATFLSVRLRQLSVAGVVGAGELGDEFRFSLNCPRKECGELNPLMIMLNERECSWRGESDMHRGRFEGQLRDGTPFAFRLLPLEDQPKLRDAADAGPDKLMSTMMYHQLLSIGGRGVASPRDLQRLTKRERLAIWQAMEAEQVGIDVQATSQCFRCGMSWQHPLPLSASKSFFFPSATNSSS